MGGSWLKGINKISRQLPYGSWGTEPMAQVLSNCRLHNGKHFMAELYKGSIMYVICMIYTKHSTSHIYNTNKWLTSHKAEQVAV